MPHAFWFTPSNKNNNINKNNIKIKRKKKLHFGFLYQFVNFLFITFLDNITKKMI